MLYVIKFNFHLIDPPACVPGRYGENCVQNCSVHCAGQDKSCDGTTGACLSGCEPGYGGLACDLGKVKVTGSGLWSKHPTTAVYRTASLSLIFLSVLGLSKTELEMFFNDYDCVGK